MRILRGKVVNGAVVTRAKLRDGARVTVIEHDMRAPARLSRAEQADVRAGLEEIDAGQILPIEQLKARLLRERSRR